jgi:hypothetical protein
MDFFFFIKETKYLQSFFTAFLKQDSARGCSMYGILLLLSARGVPV